MARTTDAQWSLFLLKSRTFELVQTNWADKFWGIWGVFGRTISAHFGTLSPMSMFSIDTGDRLGSSWFRISRDKFENTASLGHIYPYSRSPLFNHYFYKKISHIPNIYLGLGFEFGIWIWATKNQKSIIRVSVVRV